MLESLAMSDSELEEGNMKEKGKGGEGEPLDSTSSCFAPSVLRLGSGVESLSDSSDTLQRERVGSRRVRRSSRRSRSSRDSRSTAPQSVGEQRPSLPPFEVEHLLSRVCPFWGGI